MGFGWISIVVGLLLATHRNVANASSNTLSNVAGSQDFPTARCGSLEVGKLFTETESTDGWILVLTCGTLAFRGRPPVDVMWTTPLGEALPSTRYENGKFFLHLSENASVGAYSCYIPRNSPSTAGLPENAAILGVPSIYVNASELLLVKRAADVPQKTTLSLTGSFQISKAGFCEGYNGLSENITDLMEQLDENKEKLAEVTQVCNARLDEIQRQLTEMKEMKGSSGMSVSFSARLTRSMHVKRGSTIILRRVLSNQGNAYDNTKGTFTAPTAGTYFFAATTSSSTLMNFADLSIVVERAKVASVYTDEDRRNMGACHVIVPLKQGQRVWLQSDEGYFYFETTTFSGFLLSANA